MPNSPNSPSTILILVLLVLVTACSGGRSENGYANIHGALHRVEYGENAAYLFGTMHAGNAHWFPLSPLVEDALRRSDVLAVEFPELAYEWDVTDEIRSKFRYLPDGQTWEEFLPEEYYRHLANMAAEWEVYYDVVRLWNPQYYMNAMFNWFNDYTSETNFDNWVDGYVISVAQEMGIPIIGLESMEQQLDIIFNPPKEVLMKNIRDFGPPGTIWEWRDEWGMLSLDEFAYAYERNDFATLNNDDAIGATIDPDCISTIYRIDMVLNWRSTYYANEIARLLRETKEPTTFFVAVGLSHIIRSGAGEQFTDIVEQLGLLGFSVARLYK